MEGDERARRRTVAAAEAALDEPVPSEPDDQQAHAQGEVERPDEFRSVPRQSPQEQAETDRLVAVLRELYTEEGVLIWLGDAIKRQERNL